ncbi:TlpA family protein disulfide reductase [Paenibacillus solisilvae]|uniref:TlpA family protein disulfide reductase n=1 Tax=Paenibacillus solisilvae TaxID=2486751 RepID=A0ABW0VXV7_9BACL
MIKTITVLVAALILVLYAGYEAHNKMINQTTAKITPHGMVPVLKLEGFDGEIYQVGGPREKPLVVNFWASWCVECQEEASVLKQIHDKYNSQFDLYSVNVTMKDSIAEVRKFVNHYDLNYPILLDSNSDAAVAYRVVLVPTTFLIEKKGLLKEAIHVLPPDQLEAKIVDLIHGTEKTN